VSFLYPRTIAIHRPATATTVGAQGYSGETAAVESVIIVDIPASIQQAPSRGSPEGGLPADSPMTASWKIFIPKSAAALGLIQNRDVVIDDLGARYVVIANYWNSLGYRLFAQLLQA
jgi:hypothetical protein